MKREVLKEKTPRTVILKLTDVLLTTFVDANIRLRNHRTPRNEY